MKMEPYTECFRCAQFGEEQETCPLHDEHVFAEEMKELVETRERLLKEFDTETLADRVKGVAFVDPLIEEHGDSAEVEAEYANVPPSAYRHVEGTGVYTGIRLLTYGEDIFDAEYARDFLLGKLPPLAALHMATELAKAIKTCPLAFPSPNWVSYAEYVFGKVEAYLSVALLHVDGFVIDVSTSNVYLNVNVEVPDA